MIRTRRRRQTELSKAQAQLLSCVRVGESRSGRLTGSRRRSIAALDQLSLMDFHAQAALSQRHPGVRGGGARRKLRRRADELHVTPAAISRMVQLLEQRLGVPLFERKANRLTLTAAGPCLSDRPDASLRPARQSDGAGHGDGRVACADCRRRTDLRDALADPAARLFQKQEPDIEVRFATGGATLPYNDEWTCGIRLGGGDWPGFGADRLFAADFTPVCSPATAKRLKRPDDLRERDAAAGGACRGRMATLVQKRRTIENSREGAGVRILRPGAAGGRRRRRRCDRHQPLYRR